MTEPAAGRLPNSTIEVDDAESDILSYDDERAEDLEAFAEALADLPD